MLKLRKNEQFRKVSEIFNIRAIFERIFTELCVPNVRSKIAVQFYQLNVKAKIRSKIAKTVRCQSKTDIARRFSFMRKKSGKSVNEIDPWSRFLCGFFAAYYFVKSLLWNKSETWKLQKKVLVRYLLLLIRGKTEEKL